MSECYSVSNINDYLSENNLTISQLYFNACNNGFYSLVKFILEHYKNVDTLFRYKLNILNVAGNGHLEILKFLVKLDPSRVNTYDLMLAATINNHIAVVEYLLPNTDVSINDYYLFKLAVSKKYNELALMFYLAAPVKTLEYRKITDWVLKYSGTDLLHMLLDNTDLACKC